MAVAADITALEAAEAKVASQSADGVSETNRSASDIIALSKYKRQLQSESVGGLGIKIRQIVPSGAVR